MSCGDRIFLLDVPALILRGHADALHDGMRSLMTARHVLKLGFGLKQDLERLAKADGALAPCAPSAVRPAVDLGQMWQKRAARMDRAGAATGRSRGRGSGRAVSGGIGKGSAHGPREIPGLSSLVLEAYGQPLSKAIEVMDGMTVF